MSQAPQNKEIQEDIDKYASISALSNLEGGKILIGGLKSDILSAISFLSGNYKTAPEMELRTVCAKLDINLNLYRAMTRAEKNKQLAIEELENLLAE